MISTTTRCAFVDLASRDMDIREVDVQDGFGGWDIHLLLQKDLEVPVLALSTGLLTGTGAPGSGAVTWCIHGNDGIEIVPSEGRIGPVCRYGQIDHLIFTNKSDTLWDLSIENGGATFSCVQSGDHLAQEIYKAQNKCKPSYDSVLVAFGADGIVEDGCFCLGGASLSRLFRAKGLNSLTVSGTGKIDIFDNTTFLIECAKLYQYHAKITSHGIGNKAMVHYLSIQNGADEEYTALNLDSGDVATAAAALTGVFWGEQSMGVPALETISGLLRASTGQKITSHTIESYVHRLMKQAGTNEKGR